MKEEFKKTYIKLLVPVVIFLVLIYLARLLEIIDLGSSQANRFISILLFVLAVSFSIAFPIFYRAWFANKVKDQKETSVDDFIRFEKNLMIIAMTAPYFSLFAVLFNLPAFYFAGVVLFGIYSVYYYYPSDKRVDFEKKLFRVR